jgi:hypothetical protein
MTRFTDSKTVCSLGTSYRSRLHLLNLLTARRTRNSPARFLSMTLVRRKPLSPKTNRAQGWRTPLCQLRRPRATQATSRNFAQCRIRKTLIRHDERTAIFLEAFPLVLGRRTFAFWYPSVATSGPTRLEAIVWILVQAYLR